MKRIYIGVVPAVLLKLLDTKAHALSGDELLVLEAIRRSAKDLTNATVDEISGYVSAFSPDQLQGFTNNVKGIYHEIKFADLENADEDVIEAKLYELTNHPGSDVRLINTETGVVTDIQLKATDSHSSITEHLERYPDIELRATEEIAAAIPGIDSTGLSNATLSNDVSTTVDTLTEGSEYVESAVAVSGLLSAVVNAKGVLDGKQTRSAATRKTLEDLGIAGASAAIIELLVG